MKAYGEVDSQAFNWAIGLNRKCLDIIGVWPKSQEKHAYCHQTLQVILESILFTVCAVWPQFYALILFRNDLYLVVQNIFTLIEYLACVIKIMVLWVNMEALQGILDSVIMDWKTFETRNAWQQHIMLTVANRGRLLTNICLIASCMAVGIFITLPALGYNPRDEVLNVTNLNGRNLPFSSHYPYDFSKSPYFEICYISQVACCTLGIFCFTTPVTLFGVFVYHVCGQIDILCLQMENLSDALASKRQKYLIIKSKYYLPVTRDGLWYANLGKIVSSHAKIIRTVGYIEQYINLIALVQIIISPVTLGVAGFAIVTYAFNKDGEKLPITHLLLFGSTIIIALGHIFMFCYFGENLINHSEKLHKSIYKTKWYMHGGKNSLALIPIMARSQQPLRLSAGKCVHLNFETFCNILKTIASYLSMLVAVNAQLKGNI